MPSAAIERIFTHVSDHYSPEAMRLSFIQTAMYGINEYMARQPEPIPYVIEVNGSVVSTEFSVPIGPATISYVLQRLPQVGRFALDTAKQLSPQGPTGRYKNAWFLIADSVEVNRNRIPANVQELILINDEPYARKISIRGAIYQAIPPGIVERVRQLVLRRYSGFVVANIEFHTLRGGYILKRNTKRHRAGEEMTYPCLVIRSRV